jgi:hypothetical protein
MKDSNIDEYVVYFDNLVNKAGYDLQTLKKFTNGLLIGLFENIYQFDTPQTYEQWRQAALSQQKKWIHMQSLHQAQKNLNAYKPTTPPCQSQLSQGPARFIPPSCDLNAMDVDQIRG